MSTTTQQWRTVFEQALLAKAAYADLIGISFSDATVSFP